MIDVVAAAAKIRLLKHGFRKMHLGNVTSGASDLREQLTALFDSCFGGLVRRSDKAERHEPSQFGGGRLRRVVDSQRGDVADRQFSRNAVPVRIGARLVSEAPDELLA